MLFSFERAFVLILVLADPLLTPSEYDVLDVATIGAILTPLGLACDNLLSVELVTASGDVVRASENEHPELFWMLHGGGGNFGVATSFTLRLYELSSLTVMLLVWSPEAGVDVLRTYRDFMESAPDNIGGGALFVTGLAEECVPASLVGRLAFVDLITYAGPLS